MVKRKQTNSHTSSIDCDNYLILCTILLIAFIFYNNDNPCKNPSSDLLNFDKCHKRKHRKKNVDCDNYPILCILLLILFIFYNDDPTILDEAPNSDKNDNSFTNNYDENSHTYEDINQHNDNTDICDDDINDDNINNSGEDTIHNDDDNVHSNYNDIDSSTEDNSNDINTHPHENTDIFTYDIADNNRDTSNENITHHNDNSDKDTNYDSLNKDDNKCEAKVINSKIFPTCPNEYIEPCGKNGTFVAKLPVVISELKVEINCASSTKFDEAAVEIRRVTQDVCLRECKLISKINKLFIKGYVKRTIEYVPFKCSKHRKYGEKLKQISINLPFERVTRVNYFTPPEINENEPVQELNIYDSDTLDGNIIEHHSINKKYLNENVYCELVKTKILGAYSQETDGNKTSPTTELSFKGLDEQMILYLTLRLVQNQKLNIISNNVV